MSFNMCPQGSEWLLYWKVVGLKGLIYYDVMQCYVHEGILNVLVIGSSTVLFDFHKGGLGTDCGSSIVESLCVFALIQWWVG